MHLILKAKLPRFNLDIAANKYKQTNTPLKRKVFVAMSGGVDSSVAALLLQRDGYDLVGCYIKGWYPSGVVCGWKEDRRDAMRVCAKLGIPFITIDAKKEYKKEVVDYMINEYKIGRTPNPDIMCNKSVKFGVFLKKALELGADFIATGHYARLREVKSQKSKVKSYQLLSAIDLNKDQSYFLWTLMQEQLKHCLFPLGDLLKPEVRKIAEENDLPTALKDESQGVCFIGEFNMEKFLKKHIKSKKGKVITVTGEAIGEHNGAVFYTIGQRHGFGYGGGRGGPYYVVDKDIERNILIVAEEKDEKKFERKKAEIEEVNWISGKEPDFKKTYFARARYRQPLHECKIIKDGNKIVVAFEKPQRAVTSGQSLVMYDKEEMIGGGIII